MRWVILTKKALHQRLGSTYGTGYADGANASPFSAGGWLGDTSRKFAGYWIHDAEVDRARANGDCYFDFDIGLLADYCEVHRYPVYGGATRCEKATSAPVSDEPTQPRPTGPRSAHRRTDSQED